jgi:hypothetical protein
LIGVEKVGLGGLEATVGRLEDATFESLEGKAFGRTDDTDFRNLAPCRIGEECEIEASLSETDDRSDELEDRCLFLPAVVAFLGEAMGFVECAGSSRCPMDFRLP